MMRRRQLGAGGIATAALLTVVALLLGWLCQRVTAREMLLLGTPSAMAASPDDPDLVLDRAGATIVPKGGLNPATLAAVQQVATTAPLDARPYLLVGQQQLRDRQSARAIATFEAGQRLDPREQLIHVMLLDRYLRTRRYADAAAQMSVLTRVNGATDGPVAMALASMALRPEMHEAVSRTLRTDPVLEKSVLIALAKANIPPATIFALASPAARARAGQPDSWGPALVGQLVGQHRYAAARAVWQRIYGLSDAAAAMPIFNAAFLPSRTSPPFNWTLVAGSLGAADMKGGGLAIDYYGRDSGDLTSQLIVLAPGAYRFSFTVDPGKSDTGSHLLWALTCVGADKPLMTTPIAAGPSPRRLGADLVIPSNCPAQQLTLRGEAGDLPAPISMTVRSPAIVRAGASS